MILAREALGNLIEDDLATRNVNAGLIEAEFAAIENQISNLQASVADEVLIIF